jgi:hypothetical protein
VSFAAITLCVASQRVFVAFVFVYFIIDSVRKLLETPSYFKRYVVGVNEVKANSYGLLFAGL